MGFRNRKAITVKILDGDAHSPLSRSLDQLVVPVPKFVWFIRSAPALPLSRLAAISLCRSASRRTC